MANYYFNHTTDHNWGTLSNWWLDSDFTLSASELPGPLDDVIVNNNNVISFFDGVDVDVNSILLDNSYFDPSEGSGYGIKANNFTFLNGSSVNFLSLTGDCLFYQSYEDGGNNITGNVTLSGSNYTSSNSTINGNLFIHYPTIAGNLNLPTVNGTITLVNYKFEEYPDYNFTISGLSDLSANVFYGYTGFSGGKPRWESLDGIYYVYYNSPDNKWWFESEDFSIISDQENIDYPWNVESWTIDQGGVSGTPVFNLVPFNKSDIVVSGIGDTGVEGVDLNGTYVLGYRGFGDWWGDLTGEQDGINSKRLFYVKTNGSIFYQDWSYVIKEINYWVIYNDNLNPYDYIFSALSNPTLYYPTEATNWELYSNDNPITGTPSITFASDSPVARRNAKYATATEDGTHRFRRMFALGYV